MAQIGCLGDIVFVVSTNKTETIDNMQWSGSALYSEHQRHLIDSLTEFTGVGTDKMSFDILLSAYLGTDPQAEIGKIFQHERSGKTLPLVIGEKAYGKYRWTIKDHRAKVQQFDAKGNLMAAVVSVNLIEYLRG